MAPVAKGSNSWSPEPRALDISPHCLEMREGWGAGQTMWSWPHSVTFWALVPAGVRNESWSRGRERTVVGVLWVKRDSGQEGGCVPVHRLCAVRSPVGQGSALSRGCEVWR